MVLLGHRGASVASLYFLSVNFQGGNTRGHFDAETRAPCHGLIPVEKAYSPPEGS